MAVGPSKLTEFEEQVWSETLRYIEADGGGGNLDIWLRKARLLRIEDGVVHIEVLNEFCRDWIRERYLGRLCAGLARQLGRAAQVVFHLADGTPLVREEGGLPAPPPSSVVYGSLPDVRCTFDRFVTGPSNQLAYDAARSIAEQPTDAIYPLYIYAPSGLGKTHLLCAVANRAAARRPGCRVFYLSAQRFVEDFVRAVRTSTLESFDRRYREECDLLLLDDVHSLGGKDGTQDRFYHIFDALQQRRVPIVVTSDQRPQEIPGLEERLRTRLLGGLLADIGRPEFETRVAILRRKAHDRGLTLPLEVAHLLASRITGSVRELEGVIARLAAESQSRRRPADLALAQRVLDAVLPARPPPCTIDDIQRAVCSACGIQLSDLRGRSRRRSATLPRHIAMYLARECLRLPLATIGEHFGNRDHTTVMAACQHVTRLIEKDAETRNMVLGLRQQLGLT